MRIYIPGSGSSLWHSLSADRFRPAWAPVAAAWRRGRLFGHIAWYARHHLGRWLRGRAACLHRVSCAASGMCAPSAVLQPPLPSLPLLSGIFVDATIWVLLRAFTGFSMAGAFMVIESWLNERASNETRGKIFGMYMMVNYGATMTGQMLVAAGRCALRSPVDDLRASSAWRLFQPQSPPPSAPNRSPKSSSI